MRYSSPVDGRGPQVADPAAQPGRVEGVQAGVDLGDLRARRRWRPCPPRSARRCRPRCGRPGRGRSGRCASTDTSAIAAWSMARASSSAASRSARTSGTSPETHEDLLDVVGRARRGRRAARRRSRAGTSWSAVSARPATASRTASVGRRVDDERPRAGGRHGGVEHVVDHGAAADPVEDLGRGRLHARAEAGREHDGDGAAHGRRRT